MHKRSPIFLLVILALTSMGQAMAQGKVKLTIESWRSFLVTASSLVLILFCSSMAAFALAEYKSRLNVLTGLYLAIGIMVPDFCAKACTWGNSRRR